MKRPRGSYVGGVAEAAEEEVVAIAGNLGIGGAVELLEGIAGEERSGCLTE